MSCLSYLQNVIQPRSYFWTGVLSSFQNLNTLTLPDSSIFQSYVHKIKSFFTSSDGLNTIINVSYSFRNRRSKSGSHRVNRSGEGPDKRAGHGSGGNWSGGAEQVERWRQQPQHWQQPKKLPVSPGINHALCFCRLLYTT